MAQHVPPVAGCHGALHEVALYHFDGGVPSVATGNRGDRRVSRLHASPSVGVDEGAGRQDPVTGEVWTGGGCGHSPNHICRSGDRSSAVLCLPYLLLSIGRSVAEKWRQLLI